MKCLLTTTALLGILTFGQATPVFAQNACADGSDPKAYILQQSIPLAEAMPKQVSSGPWPRIFHQRTVELSYTEGQRIIVSGPREGLRTDDLALIEVSPSGQRWEHDFRNAAHTHIDVLKNPPDISLLFKPGSNQLTLTLTDLIGPEWSTSDYTLLVLEPCQRFIATPTAIPTATPVALLPTVTPAIPAVLGNVDNENPPQPLDIAALPQHATPRQAAPSIGGGADWLFLLLAVIGGGATWWMIRRSSQLRNVLTLLQTKVMAITRTVTPYIQAVWQQLKAEISDAR